MPIPQKLAAVFIGTFWLVLGGCGAAVLAGGISNFAVVGIGYEGVALAFGLTVLTGAYAFGHVSGAHFNPAVTFGLFMAGKFPRESVIPYWVAQLAGGVVAGGVLYLIASGGPGFDPSAGFASNGYGSSNRASRCKGRENRLIGRCTQIGGTDYTGSTPSTTAPFHAAP